MNLCTGDSLFNRMTKERINRFIAEMFSLFCFANKMVLGGDKIIVKPFFVDKNGKKFNKFALFWERIFLKLLKL